MEVIWFILIGLAAGWLAGQIMGAGYRGWLGGLLFQTTGISVGGGLLGSLVVATVGVVTLIFSLRRLQRV